MRNVLSTPPTIIDRAWAIETVATVHGEHRLDPLTLLATESDELAVAVVDQGFHLGTQSTALARRTAAGWRMEVVDAGAAALLCAETRGPQVVVTRGFVPTDPPQSLAWDGVRAEPLRQAQPCARPGNTRSFETPSGTHQLELQNANRFWHDAPAGTSCPPHDAPVGMVIGAHAAAVDTQGVVHLALFESPEVSTPGRLRHAECKDGTWTSSVIDDGHIVDSVDLWLDRTGQPHVAFGYTTDGTSKLALARPESSGLTPISTGNDANAWIDPATEACTRLWTAPPRGEGVEPYQSGDGLRCSQLTRSEAIGTAAVDRLTARCSDGDAMACALAGSMFHWVMGDPSLVLQPPGPDGSVGFSTTWSGLRPEGIDEDRARAARLFDTACQRLDDASGARACMHQAFVLPTGDPLRTERAIRACGAGLDVACSLALAVTALRPAPDDEPTITARLGEACDAGAAIACHNLGVLRRAQGDAAAVDRLARACDLGHEPSCALRSAP